MKKLTKVTLSSSVAFLLMIFLITGFTNAQDIQVIFRGDDFGMTQGSLVAFEKAFNEGVLCAASIIVPAPWFEGAAELCKKNPGWCTGVHLCLVGEWRGFRWRPVLSYDKVPSLVDEDGYLYTYPKELFPHKPKLSEIDAEFRAQIDLAKKKGVNVQYIDTHYMYPDSIAYSGLSDIIKKIGKDYNIPVSTLMGEKREEWVYSVSPSQKKEAAVKILDNLKSGLYLWVCHIGIDSPEQNALIHTSPEDIFIDAGVGKHRAAELETLTSLEIKSILFKKGIKMTNYRELWKK